MKIVWGGGWTETTEGTAVTVNSIVVGPTSTEGVNKFLANLAKKANVSLAEIETNFFKTERPGSLFNALRGQKKSRIWSSITPAHCRAQRMGPLSASTGASSAQFSSPQP